jgi:hypothetical protein
MMTIAGLVAGLAAPATAAADILTFEAQAQVGAAGGQGIAGDRKDEAFSAGAAGLDYGGRVGVEFLYLDGWIEHNQFRNGDGLTGTWTQFMAGIDFDADLGAKSRGIDATADKKAANENPDAEVAYSPYFSELGLAVGFGVGTGQQVEPPLDNSQVTDKGFLVQASLGLGYRITRSLSLGLTVPVQLGFMFKSGAGAVANDYGNQYETLNAAALLNLRFDLKLK